MLLLGFGSSLLDRLGQRFAVSRFRGGAFFLLGLLRLGKRGGFGGSNSFGELGFEGCGVARDLLLQVLITLLQLGQAFSSAMTGANGDVKKEADLLKQFADKTPSDIRPDFETLAEAMEKIADAMKGVKVGGTPDPASLAKLTQLATQLDSPKLTAAEQHIQTWAQNNCHS